MLVQQGHSAEGASARAALVLLHLGVGLQVGAQVGAVGEGPVTELAGEGALACGDEGQTISDGASLAGPPGFKA